MPDLQCSNHANLSLDLEGTDLYQAADPAAVDVFVGRPTGMI